MNDQDDDLFAREMGDVKKIQRDERVPLEKDKPSPQSLDVRRAAAAAVTRKDTNFLSGEHIDPVQPLDILEFKRAGVQHGVYRKLRLGKYSIDARLDLHRMTVEEARGALYQFIRDCMDNDIRCALITHGKGEGRAKPALLKSCVANWLPMFDDVLAFHSAQKHHGASGATYILLKKSEQKRQENWERHSRRKNNDD
ncbi:DNA endonuclease SmrA [Gilvimarinus sp. SDUM040013]|uniref:DNA endonuclease SmrA n=1 Tax=Gilvimarinus gilvus TaxID=3058038 RepID=A0ABU4RTM0_9GAMM|nr:DNA endonuclease SmrA [Gilvimarinus sp. SDUM040013]MDO3386835.1 DNA endonuclease SmrA [Gilvimarinus sp. SDUM040013]MDX6848235.1 DNA endonuclease SmrA [Gilvimarinus sp. SDUM040013]